MILSDPGVTPAVFQFPFPFHPPPQSMPALPTRVSSAPPAENVQGYESTHGYYRPAMDKQQQAAFLVVRAAVRAGAGLGWIGQFPVAV